MYANDKVDSDVRLNAMLLDVWEANANQDIYILIRLSLTMFVFFGRIGKTRWPPWHLIDWDIFDFSSETAEQNSMKLDRKQDLSVLYQVCVFSGRSEKQDGHPVFGWDIFDVSS